MRRARRRGDDGVELRPVVGTFGTQYYLTARCDETAGDSPERAYEAVVAALAERAIEPIQEQIYGRAVARERILDARARAFAARRIDADTPCAFLEGRPVLGGDFAGVQIWGVGPGTAAPRAGSAPSPSAPAAGMRRAPRVDTVDCAGRRGRLWSGEGFRLLYVPSITGAADGGVPRGDAPAQAERMFANARESLRSRGFAFSQVLRTWIYLRRILDWYGDFNKVRNGLYRDPGFFGAASEDAFPASTGIQGRLGDEECAMHLLALDAGDAARVGARPILRSARQDRAFAYRSAFSRAMGLRLGDVETLYVSGTASINAAGESVYRGDVEGQILQTFLSVASLLEEQGADLEDVRSATLYCRDREAYEAYVRMSRLLRLPPLPIVAVLADVCRPELRIELEATAAAPAGRAGRR